MPFTDLRNAQQIEIVVAGPGDVNRLYVCKGLADGSYELINVAPGQQQWSNDTWQFEVGPQLDVTQFRRAIATASFAGLQAQEAGPANISWMIQSVFADFDDDAGKVRVSVTNALFVANQATQQTDFAGVTVLGYDVSILAALPAGA